MPDSDWAAILDRFEADLERGLGSADGSWVDWAPPAEPVPLTPATADRARRVLSRQRDLLARLRAAQSEIADELQSLRAVQRPAAIIAGPAYLDQTG
jgi:hypothetical protein